MFYKKYGKRLFDISIILVSLPITIPLIIIISIIILLFSGTPIFYKAKRVGKNYKFFTMYKFRTMYLNQEKKHGDTTGYNDPRITYVGKYLRKFKIDELPQIFNVLIGNMSLVGPRPELEYYYLNFYTKSDLNVLDVKPGITDFFSIKYFSLDKIVGSEDPENFFKKKILPEKIDLRIKYINQMSLLTDIKIIYGTIKTIILKVIKA